MPLKTRYNQSIHCGLSAAAAPSHAENKVSPVCPASPLYHDSQGVSHTGGTAAPAVAVSPRRKAPKTGKAAVLLGVLFP